MTSIRFRMDVTEEVPHQPVSSAARHNLVLVVKEALNNVVKHSAATEVWVRAKTERGDLTFEIEDNGKGFEQQPDGLGNGLGNMAKRMKEVGGGFNLESCSGEGTRIKISVPLCQGVRCSTRLRAGVL